ncbi:MAG: hypothetical protein LJE68_05585 [Rhodobacter sp.]|nr:hypothetical protein [Rhodobacter sp.]
MSVVTREKMSNPPKKSSEYIVTGAGLLPLTGRFRRERCGIAVPVYRGFSGEMPRKTPILARRG